jgi:hypothetical protein
VNEAVSKGEAATKDAPVLDSEVSVTPQKRVFIALLGVSCIVLAGLAFLLWWIPVVGLSAISPYLPAVLAGAFGFVVLVVVAGSLLLTLTILTGQDFLSKKLRGVVIKVLFPLLVIVGKLFRISRERISQSFVAINNQLVLAESRTTAPSCILLLMPHCLQNHDCTVRITGNVENCKACGKCPIKDLRDLAHTYKVDLAVATGGTIARRIVVEKRPEIIIAVACERDLTSGIQDTYPLPVYGILNRRPHGPCFDTEVPVGEVERIIRLFVGKHE